MDNRMLKVYGAKSGFVYNALVQKDMTMGKLFLELAFYYKQKTGEVLLPVRIGLVGFSGTWIYNENRAAETVLENLDEDEIRGVQAEMFAAGIELEIDAVEEVAAIGDEGDPAAGGDEGQGPDLESGPAGRRGVIAEVEMG